MARSVPEDPYCGLAEPGQLAGQPPALDICDPAEPSPEHLIERAAACEDAARAVAGITNNGVMMPPTLVRRPARQKAQGRRVVSARTSAQLRQLMRMVVERGTGRKADATGYRVGGKTGTADKPGPRGYSRKRLVSSFVAAFPMDRPRFLVLAIVDEPKGTKETHGYATGGWVAAPIVRNVVARTAPLLGVRPVLERGPVMEYADRTPRARNTIRSRGAGRTARPERRVANF